MLVLVYLVSIVAANMSVAHFGPASMPINAFIFIGLDLTLRDRLHESWHNKNLWAKMGALIAAGSIISYALNAGAGRIALASFLAFLAAGVIDAIVYQVLFPKTKFVKINSSNVISSAVDSVVFPTIAFGQIIWWAILGQFIAKVVGGFVWSLVLNRRVENEN